MKKNVHYKIFFIFVLMLSITLMASAKSKVINSIWTGLPVNIDGSTEDWAEHTLSFEKKVKVDYAFRNDSGYLYVLFILKDPKYLTSISATGMTIYFNTEGKKKKDSGIIFSNKRISAEQFIALIEQQQGPLPKERKSQIKNTPYYYIQNYTIINKKKQSSSPVEESVEVKRALFRFAKGQDTVVYEFAIPLEKRTELATGIGTEPGKTIKIGFEWGGMTKAMKEARMKQMGDQTIRTVATKAGGLKDTRSDGRASSGTMSSMRKRGPKKYSFWADVQLAIKQ